MGRQVIYGDDARSELKKGVDILANAVKVTLGPKGRHVVIDLNNQDPFMTKDGVTVARFIYVDDPLQNIGAQLVKNVAQKTASDAGDGTTTATVLAQAILTSGLKSLSPGVNPMELKKGIDMAVEIVTMDLKKQSRKITPEKTIQIATISANGDASIGALIADAVKKVGRDGVITIEESKDAETTVKMEDGMLVERGYLSPYLVTDPKSMKAVLEDVRILLVDRKITDFKELVPALEIVINKKQQLLIICDDIEGPAFEMLIKNKRSGLMNVCAIKSPGYGEGSFELMTDIAIATGATLITKKANLDLAKIKNEDLGYADKVVVSKISSTIIKGKGNPDKIRDRVEVLKENIKNSDNDIETNNLKERLAKLSAGIAVLYIGAATEVEMREKKDRVDDALHATRAAIEEGIVPGGGIALLRSMKSLDKLKGSNEDQDMGIAIVRKALEEPFRQICTNAGKEPSVLINSVLQGKGDWGYNARNDCFQHLIDAGVIDPTKVTRIALENSASIAAMILTTECVLSDTPAVEPNKK